MSKLTAVLPLLFVVACGPSNQEIQDTATITCNIMTEPRSMGAVIRIKKINAAREKIGEDIFLGKDTDILLSFKHGLCESLVRNDDDYEFRLIEKQNQEALVLAEQKRILANNSEVQEQVNKVAAAKAAEIKVKENQKRLKALIPGGKGLAAERQSYWSERKERISAAEKIREREEKLVAYWRNLNNTQWEKLYPKQTSMQKDGWERCKTMVESAGEACKKNWRRVHDRWRQVVKERMIYWETLKKSDRYPD